MVEGKSGDMSRFKPSAKAGWFSSINLFAVVMLQATQYKINKIKVEVLSLLLVLQ